MDRRFQFYYIGIDGNKTLMTTEQPKGVGELCCISCCPCFVKPLCSEEKQHAYVNAMKSFCFVVSVVQMLMLIIALGMGGFAPPSMNPSLGPPGATLLDLGAKYAPLMKEGQVWRFVTPIFLHAGFIHIFFNLFAQLRFGLAMERKWGLIKFIVLYFVSGIGGNLLSALISYETVGVGASGAIMGLMGGFLSEVLMTWSKTDAQTRNFNLIQITAVVGITMLFSMSKYVDLGAHLGGFIVGLLVGLALFSRDSMNDFSRKHLGWIAGTVLAIYFVTGFAVFYAVM